MSDPILIDLHCHLLPGIDDGASNKNATVDLMRKEEADGVRAVMFTPHFYYERMGLDSFADWQVLNWPHSAQSCGAAAYSETAQVYLVVNYDDGITLSAVSMTPKSFAEFNHVFSKEDGT